MSSKTTSVNCGLDLLTGNHNVWSQLDLELFSQKEIVEYFDEPPELKILPVIKAIPHCGSSLDKVDLKVPYLQKLSLKCLITYANKFLMT